VLTQPGPERGPARNGQRVSADAYNPAATAVGAVLAVLVEEVDTVAWPAVLPGAVAQPTRPSFAPGQAIQQEVEPIGVVLPVAAQWRRSMVVPVG
jgi:hypothetical protein